MNIFANICSDDTIRCRNAKRTMASLRELFFPPTTARVSCKRISPIIENSWGQRMAQEECVEPESSRVSGKGVTWARWKFRVHGNGEVATSMRVTTRASIIERDWIFKDSLSRAWMALNVPFCFVLSTGNDYILRASVASFTSNANFNLTVGGHWSFQSNNKS